MSTNLLERDGRLYNAIVNTLAIAVLIGGLSLAWLILQTPTPNKQTAAPTPSAAGLCQPGTQCQDHAPHPSRGCMGALKGAAA